MSPQLAYVTENKTFGLFCKIFGRSARVFNWHIENDLFTIRMLELGAIHKCRKLTKSQKMIYGFTNKQRHNTMVVNHSSVKQR